MASEDYHIDPWFEALANLGNVGVLMYDPDATLRFSGGIINRLLRLESEEQLDARLRPLSEMVRDRHCSCENKDAPLEWRQILEIETVDGIHPLEVTAYRIETESCEGVLILVTDSEQERRQRKDLRLASRFRNLGEVYQSMAHDLRTPVASLNTSIRVLRKLVDQHIGVDRKEAALFSHWLDVVDDSRQTLDESLTMVLSEFGTADEAETTFDFRALLQTSERMVFAMAQQLNIAVSLDLPGKPVEIHGMAAQLKLVVLNLCTNAIQAMADGGVLGISLKMDGNNAVLEVTDTGGGIPDDIRDRIFDRYFTTRASGTGIGLHVVEESVKRMDGRLEFESEVGKGTCFRVILPATAS